MQSNIFTLLCIGLFTESIIKKGFCEPSQFLSTFRRLTDLASRLGSYSSKPNKKTTKITKTL